MRHYGTLFDGRYLPQGLVLYESLKKHSSEDFRLWVLAMDGAAYRALRSLSLTHIEIIAPDCFEWDMQLHEARTNRTWQEYCWTCASQLCEYLIKLGLDEVTYLDADMMFFGDPASIFTEIGENSIAVIPHRFREQDRERLEPNGRFNVCWNTFRNTPAGRKCVSTWAAQCRAWCYYRNEDGKFGDQAYLDAWPDEYGDELHIIQNIGAGLAPWNLGSFSYDVPIIFFHYHEYIHGERLTNYPLRQVDRDLIYSPYIENILAAKARLGTLQPA